MEVEIAVGGRVLRVSDVTFVSFKGYEGDIGILSHHATMTTLVRAGKLKLLKEGEQLDYIIGPGIAQVHQDNVRIVTEKLEGE